MTQWITDALGEASLAEATTLVSKALLADVTGVARPTLDESTGFVADSLELAVFELLDEADKRSELRSAAEKAFELLRTLQSDSANVSEKLKLLLRTACYGVLADRTPDVSRFLKDTALPELATDFSNWGEAVRNNVTVIWLKLLRKKGWEDLDAVLEGVVSLRQAQTHHESSYLETRGSQSRSAAWELIAIYHLAKAAEILATYSTQGSVSGAYNIREQLEGQFDRSTVACERAELFELFGLSKLLTRTAEQMVANSIWTVSRALAGVREQNFRPEMWTNDQLFRDGNSDLARAFGVLFKVPEIRSELSEAIHGKGADSDLLARIVKDWVHGASIPEIADSYFPNEDDKTDSITNACRSVYGKLIQTASWGLSALQSLTIGSTLDQLSAEEQRTVRNLPSRIYYGVNSDAAIDLRLLGVPRKAAQPLADAMVGGQATSGIANVRVRLNELTPAEWEAALGRRGKTYSRAWRVIEGRE